MALCLYSSPHLPCYLTSSQWRGRTAICVDTDHTGLSRASLIYQAIIVSCLSAATLGPAYPKHPSPGMATKQTKQDGFYCSTSGTYFSDKESLAEHYKSDFHRYNLKRKVASLPPVTKEWFEARKAQLTTATTAPHQKIWFDPLTKKKFQTLNTYQAHVNSKKYQELVKQSGQSAPAPVIMIKQMQENGHATNGAESKAAAPAGFTVKPPHPRAAAGGDAEDSQETSSAAESDEDVDTDGWETVSEDGADSPAAASAAAASNSSRGSKQRQQPAVTEDQESDDAAVPEEDWVKWDPCVSLFDNKRSSSMQENLEYMYKHFGFYLPESEYLVDPEGLLQYLGAKLQYGKVALYSAGDDPNAKQFRSLHAVQRHMVDTNQCRLLYDGHEDEYEDFYDYSKAVDVDSHADSPGADADSADSSNLALATSALGNLGLDSSSSLGWELKLANGSAGTAGSKALGSRELAKYYRQRPKPSDDRQSVAVNSIVAQYRSLGVLTKANDVPAGVKRAQKDKQRQQRQWLNLAMRTNINNNLPKNVPY